MEVPSKGDRESRRGCDITSTLEMLSPLLGRAPPRLNLMMNVNRKLSKVNFTFKSKSSFDADPEPGKKVSARRDKR